MRERFLLEILFMTEHFAPSVLKALKPTIVAPEEKCYSKEALWTDDCIKQWYEFWKACEQQNKLNDPVCLEPTKRLA